MLHYLDESFTKTAPGAAPEDAVPHEITIAKVSRRGFLGGGAAVF